MTTFLKSSFYLLLFMLGMAASAFAQDFIYTPRNPAFGGNTFNYQWMLSGANAQNGYTDPDVEDRFQRDPLADFEQDLNRQVLSQLSRNLVRNQFGDDGLEDGLTEAPVVTGPTRRRVYGGQTADELALSSARVHPDRLDDSGYTFCYPEIEEALRHQLGRTTSTDLPHLATAPAKRTA